MIVIVEVSVISNKHPKCYINAEHIVTITNPTPSDKELGANAMIKFSDGVYWSVKEYPEDILKQIPNAWDHLK